MANARRTVVCLSPPSANPRSARTLPELGVTACFPSLFRLAVSFLVILLCHPQPPGNQSNIRPTGADPPRRLLLEGMQHVYCAFEAHHVHGAICGAIVVFYDLQDARPFAVPGLRRVFAAGLRHAESRADAILHRFGERQQIPFRGAHQDSPATGLRAMIPISGHHGLTDPAAQNPLKMRGPDPPFCGAILCRGRGLRRVR
jgi:hypothetical protein